MRFFVPRKSLRNGPMTTGVLRHLTESNWSKHGDWTPSQNQWPPHSQHRPTTGSPHCKSSTGNAEWEIPCGYVIAIQLHQIHQLAVKMNIKKMFKTLKTLGRKQQEWIQTNKAILFCKQRIHLRRGKVSKHLQKHPGLLINSELQIRYNLNSEQRGGLHW